MLAALFYHLGAFFARRLPRPGARAAARAIGEVNALVRRRTRRVVAANLRAVDPSLDAVAARRASRRVILAFAQAIRVFLELPFLRWERERDRFDLSALEPVLAAIGAGPGDGRPFVLASAHLGPWELGGWVLASLGLRVHTVALDHPSRAVTRFYSDRRERVGVHAVSPRGALRHLAIALRPGACVALLVDRDVGGGGVPVRWFDRRRTLPAGAAVLAVRRGVPVVVGALVFDGPERYRYVHGGTHDPSAYAGDEAARVRALHADCVADLERLIRAHPEQWFEFGPVAEDA